MMQSWRGYAWLSLAALLTGKLISAQQPVPLDKPLTLQEAIKIAQRQGPAADAARSARDAARYRDRAFNARLMPQVSFTGNVADFDRGFNPVTLDNGETKFVRRSQNQSSFGLTAEQRLPWTGGLLSVSSLVSRIDLLSDPTTSNQFWQTTPVVIGLQQEIFKPRTIVWEQRRAVLVASVAERQYLEAREDVASNTAAAFFDLYAARVALQNASTNVAVNDTLYTLNKGRYEVGKIGENDLLQSELAVLRARASLDGAKLEQDRTEAALRRLLNLPPGDSLSIAPPDVVPTVDADPAVAVAQALHNASVNEQMELEAVQARRGISEARYGNGFSATVTAMLGFDQTAPVFGQAYQSPYGKQRLVVGVAMPFFQWGGGRADLQAARAEESRVMSNTRARRAALEEDARFAALQLSQSARMVLISAKADTVATKRFDVAKNRYVIGKIGISDLYIAQSEKDAALQAYVQALRGYWSAYYRLRRVTLYDFAEKHEIDG